LFSSKQVFPSQTLSFPLLLVVAHVKNLALECLSGETKEIICTFSAIYSYILNDDVSLDDEIQKYKNLLELDKYIY